MVANTRKNRYPEQGQSSAWKQRLLHGLGWVLLAAALFYAMHRYFEYRDRELDKRLEKLR